MYEGTQPQHSLLQSKTNPSKMFSKKFAAAFLRDAVATPATMTGLTHTSNVVKLYQAQPLAEVRVHNPRPYSYTVVNVNPYTLEEQLVLYPFVVVDENTPPESVVVSLN
jgi:hypothetical protein